MNNNLVNKNNEEEEYEEYEELPEEIEEKEKQEDNKKINKSSKKITRYMVLFMAIFIGLLLVIWIVSLFVKKEYSYDEIENVLKNAAIDYFAEYKENLPQTEGDIIEIDSSNLVQAKKMKELSEYTGTDKSCTGTVQVEKTSDSYLYTPYLDCGTAYKTQKLSQAIISQGLAKQGSYGLYKINGDYVYRGENLKNYVELDKGIWRIVKVTSKGNVVLIKQEKVGYTIPYDDRYNIEKEWNSGINNYSSSRLKDYIDTYYTKPSEEENQLFLSSNDKKHLINFDLCVGKRLPEDVGNTNEKECSSLEKNVKVGLLTVSDYMMASLDSNCVKTTSESCSNYNYLVNNLKYWLITSNSANSFESYYVTEAGEIKVDKSSSYSNTRPVIYLNENTMFKSGNGTESKPYKIK